jgi:predicted dehydrogenase
VALTHTQPGDWKRVLHEVPCDSVAIGDYFGRRGELAIASLEAGKHIIVDKPICTRRAELNRIVELSSQKKLSVGCLLDLRDTGALRAMRRLIRDEAVIGEVHTITFTAQHPLLRATRPAWYFEHDKHGGTINDIAIHAIDAIPWLTGRTITSVVAARAWNARLAEVPHFQDAGQMMLALDNGGGVLGDVSYLAPDAAGYVAPQYWRITCHGSEGVVECGYDARSLSLARHADKAFKEVPADPGMPNGVFDAFLREARGETSQPGDLTTTDVLDASRRTLLIQESADRGARDVSLD